MQGKAPNSNSYTNLINFIYIPKTQIKLPKHYSTKFKSIFYYHFQYQTYNVKL